MHWYEGLCGVDMAMEFGKNLSVSVINFGMPRVGNDDFVALYDTLNISTFRTVHYHDLVPHWPFEIFDYHHVPTEIWEYNATDPNDWKVCDGSGEDPTCSDSVPIYEWNPADHMYYFGVHNNDCVNETDIVN